VSECFCGVFVSGVCVRVFGCVLACVRLWVRGICVSVCVGCTCFVKSVTKC